MRVIAFITEALCATSSPTSGGAPPRIAPARSPPLWAAASAEYDPTGEPAPPAHPGIRARPAHRR